MIESGLLEAASRAVMEKEATGLFNAQGINRVGGKVEAYEKLLSTFSRNYGKANEYILELIQKGNPDDPVHPKIVKKLIDSLSGLDQIGETVPDPILSIADRYGVSVRPRQTMFADRLVAVQQMVEYVNSIFVDFFLN